MNPTTGKIYLYADDKPIGTVNQVEWTIGGYGSSDLTFDATVTDVSTGTFTSSGTWSVPWDRTKEQLAQERGKIWRDLGDLLNGRMELSSEDIESLIELITIHGEELGKLRFILNRRDLAAL